MDTLGSYKFNAEELGHGSSEITTPSKKPKNPGSPKIIRLTTKDFEDSSSSGEEEVQVVEKSPPKRLQIADPFQKTIMVTSLF